MDIKKILPIIGISLFIFIIWRAGIGEILDILKRTSLFWLGISVLSLIPTVIIRAIKWNCLINAYGIKHPIKNSIKAYLIGFFVGVITPGRMGDAVRARYLKDEGTLSLGEKLATVGVDRLFDIVSLGFLAFLPIISLAPSLTAAINPVLLGGGILIVIALTTTLILNRHLTRALMKPFFNILVPERLKDKIRVGFYDFYKGIGKIRENPKRIIEAGTLTILTWFLVFFQYYLIAIALEINISYWALSKILPLALLIELIPISFAGIGTRDATLVLYFAAISISTANAVALSLGILTLTYILGGIGAIIWLRNPKKLW